MNSRAFGNAEQVMEGTPTNKRSAYMDCTTEVGKANKKQKICNEEVKKSKISSQLSENYGNLMDNDDLKDFVLKCAGEEIRVHKCILAARSPVFASMFKSGMDEAKVNSVDIVDVEPGILRKLLKFIYSGQIDDFTDEEAGDLLYAANKYQLDILQEVCIENLKHNLSDKNVFDAIKFGDLFDQGLKDRAMYFVAKHGSFAELRETEGWKSLHVANPALAMEIMILIVDHTQKQENPDGIVIMKNELEKLSPLRRQQFTKIISIFLPTASVDRMQNLGSVDGIIIRNKELEQLSPKRRQEFMKRISVLFKMNKYCR